MSNNDIEMRLNVILNKKLIAIGRASNMLWIGFGEELNILNFRGKEKKVSEYALHVQCAWRLIKCGKIFMANGDFYIPRTSVSDTDDFDWDVQGINRFDELNESFQQEIKSNPIIVESIQADKVGSLKVRFTQDYLLEVFPNDSLMKEYWRFIDNTKIDTEERHYVIFDS